MTSTTLQPELVQNSAPDVLICDCIDGVIAIGRDINFLHTEPLHVVIRIYSQVFDSLVFLKTDASTEELKWLAARQYYESVLWMLAEPTMSPEYRLIRILAIASAEAFAVTEARGLGNMKLDNGIRCLRWRLQDIRKEARDKRKIPGLSSGKDITSCICKAGAGFSQEIIMDVNGSWRVGSQSPELYTPAVTFRATTEQMLWLSQYPNFSTVLCTLQECFGAAEVEIWDFFALEAALNIGTFRDTLEDWLAGVDGFIYELERMLIEGVIAAEV